MTDNYRYWVSPTNDTVHRAKLVQDGDEYGDHWRNYWDTDTLVAFTDGYRRYGLNPLGGDDEGNSRAMRARAAEKAGDRGSEGALQRVAERLIAEQCGVPQSDPRLKEWAPNPEFLCVSLDQSLDLFVLVTGTDEAKRAFRTEIEAVYNEEIYRAEVVVSDGEGGWCYEIIDDEAWYGTDKAQSEFEKEFPLAEYPVAVADTETASFPGN